MILYFEYMANGSPLHVIRFLCVSCPGVEEEIHGRSGVWILKLLFARGEYDWKQCVVPGKEKETD
jgi:hypothetical protein